MKKTFLFPSLMLLALLTLGCTKSEPTDLRLFELNGDVKYVTQVVTTNVTSTGKKTRHSTQYDATIINFDTKGKLLIEHESNTGTEKQITRDKKGNIEEITIQCEKPDGGWNDAGYCETYIWNDDGFPINVEFKDCMGGFSRTEIVYNDSSEVACKITRGFLEEGEEWTSTIAYKILKRDIRGNWIKRLEINTDYYNEVSIDLVERTIVYYSDNKKSSSSDSQSYSTLSSNSTSNTSNRYDDSSTKWKEFAGTTYRASQFTSEGYQYYAFSYDRTGKGKYIIWWNYLGTNVVEDQMEFSIYKVESEGNYLYLYGYELNTPVKIQIKGSSLYSMTGDRYEIWN